MDGKEKIKHVSLMLSHVKITKYPMGKYVNANLNLKDKVLIVNPDVVLEKNGTEENANVLMDLLDMEHVNNVQLDQHQIP